MPDLSRRHFLLGAAVTGAALTAGRTATHLPPSQARFAFSPPQSPQVSTLPGRVVHVHSSNATTWAGQVNYWDYVNQAKVDEMVNVGLMTLTGTQIVADAWRSLLPNYQVGQGIAIKVSFNNSSNAAGGTAIDAVPEPINALISGLKLRGVAEDDIWIYDAIRAIPDRFYNGCDYRTGVRFYDQASRREATFDSTAPGSYVTFYPHSGDPLPPVTKVTDVIVNATYLINVPIMKVHSSDTAGVSLGFKNHWGTIDGPAGLHNYIMLDGPYRRADYNALVDVYRNPNIASKTVLTVADGLFGSINGYNQPPAPWSTFGNHAPHSLLFATDPIAIDCVMCDLIKAEAEEMPNTDSYLQLAYQAGLGVFERGNPWSTGYHTITYQRIEAAAQAATINLSAGWNLIALPFSPTVNYLADGATAEITAQGGNCTEINRWLNGGWSAYVRGLPFNNFALAPGSGFFCKCTKPSVWSLTGYPIQQAGVIQLNAGWNLISISHSAAPLTAQSLIAGINAQGGNCSEVDRWLNGGWNAYSAGLPFNNFAIESGQGYFVKCATSSSYAA